MKIQHRQLQWEDLPKAGDVVLQPVERSYLKIIYLEWAFFYALVFLLGIALFYFRADIRQPAWVILAIVTLALSILTTFLVVSKSFHFKAYAIRERDIIARSGWLFQKLEVIPVNKIQHCVVKTGPLEKKFNLASLKIYTAGQHSDITLSGLKAIEAEQLKEWVISKQRDYA